MTFRHFLSIVSVATLLALGSTQTLAVASCTSADFAAAVDASGAGLRAFTLETQSKLQERMRRYGQVAKLGDAEYENAALDAIQDATLEKLDARSSELILKVDTLGRVPEGAQPDCAKLGEVKAAAAELLTVIKTKSDYMLSRLDAKIAEAEGKTTAPVKEPKIAKSEATEKAPPPVSKTRKDTAAATAAPTPSEPPASNERWSANTKPNDAYVPPLPDTAMPPLDVAPDADDSEGYSIDEIREATRGFFGTVSTSLASVIEHAFRKSGRPTAYVLGTEGGGAFLAGLRYGQGTLYLRHGSETRKLYWHGPSVGTDFGASGGRTMFLIYKLRDPQDLYRSFTGIDGSAFIVGGVGITLLKGGDVLMAPIRSGLGLRLGANLGYVRFTERATWNPF